MIEVRRSAVLADARVRAVPAQRDAVVRTGGDAIVQTGDGGDGGATAFMIVGGLAILVIAVYAVALW